MNLRLLSSIADRPGLHMTTRPAQPGHDRRLPSIGSSYFAYCQYDWLLSLTQGSVHNAPQRATRPLENRSFLRNLTSQDNLDPLSSWADHCTSCGAPCSTPSCTTRNRPTSNGVPPTIASMAGIWRPRDSNRRSRRPHNLILPSYGGSGRGNGPDLLTRSAKWPTP